LGERKAHALGNAINYLWMGGVFRISKVVAWGLPLIVPVNPFLKTLSWGSALPSIG